MSEHWSVSSDSWNGRNAFGADSGSAREALASVESLGPFLAELAVQNDKHGRFAVVSLEALRENGLFGICAPDVLGGGGVTSLYDLASVVARIAYYDASVAVPFHMHATQSWYYARQLLGKLAPGEAGTRQRWLRNIAAGEMIVCSAVTEGGGGLPWAPNTTAEWSGETWQVSGVKRMASIAPYATHFYSRVRVEKGSEVLLASVMIERARGGVVVDDSWDGLGLRGSGSCTVTFDKVEVSPEALRFGGPWGVRDPMSLRGRVCSLAPLMAVTVGIAQAARDEATASIRDKRSTAGQSAGVYSLLAELEVEMNCCRSVLQAYLRELDQAIADPARTDQLGEDAWRAFMQRCAAAGVQIERSGIRVVDLAMQVVGGASYLAAHPLGRLVRDVRSSFFMRPYFPNAEWTDLLAAPERVTSSYETVNESEGAGVGS